MDFTETSALQATNVSGAFETLMQEIHNKKSQAPLNTSVKMMQFYKEESTQEGGCWC